MKELVLVIMQKNEKELKELVMVIIQKIKWILIKSHPLTNFEIQKYYENEPRFNGVFSRDNLLKKIKDGAYVINLDEHKDTGTHWVALFCKKNEIVYFDSFGVKKKEIKKKLKSLLVIKT